MSGIGELEVTHNVSERLYWVPWSKESKVRNSTDVLSPILGNGPEGRKKMIKVCENYHSPRQGVLMGSADYAHWHGFFELQMDLHKLQEIHRKRLETGENE